MTDARSGNRERLALGYDKVLMERRIEAERTRRASRKIEKKKFKNEISLIKRNCEKRDEVYRSHVINEPSTLYSSLEHPRAGAQGRFHVQVNSALSQHHTGRKGELGRANDTLPELPEEKDIVNVSLVASNLSLSPHGDESLSPKQSNNHQNVNFSVK